jgi:hypothetical protein
LSRSVSCLPADYRSFATIAAFYTAEVPRGGIFSRTGKELETRRHFRDRFPKQREEKGSGPRRSFSEDMDTHLPAAPLACDALSPPARRSQDPFLLTTGTASVALDGEREH